MCGYYCYMIPVDESQAGLPRCIAEECFGKTTSWDLGDICETVYNPALIRIVPHDPVYIVVFLVNPC
jgi:hypothetical protein